MGLASLHFVPCCEVVDHNINIDCEFVLTISEQPIHDIVLTVPPYFNQAERKSILQAAEFAGLKVLQLMNANTAGRSMT